MEIKRNAILELKHEAASIFERIVLVMRHKGFYVTVRLWEGRLTTPIWTAAVLNAQIESGQVRILDCDPFAPSHQQLSDYARRRRDEVWESLIVPATASGRTDLYFEETRAPLVAESCQRTGLSEPTVYRVFAQFLKGGQCRDAVAPRTQDRGAPGVIRVSGEKKRGRPPKPESLRGMNLTPIVEEAFQYATKLYLNRNKLSYRSLGIRTKDDAFQRALERYFEIKPSGDEPVSAASVIAQQPTVTHFYQYFRARIDETAERMAEQGERSFEVESTPKTGSSTLESFSTADIVQMDQHDIHVHLTSRALPSRILSTASLYLSVCTFSHFIFPPFISLREPSWMQMRLALATSMMDPFEYFGRLGITLPLDYPGGGAASSYLFDRGEGESNHAEILPAEFDIPVANTAPYRPDWKGLIEQLFNWMNERLVDLLPGAKDRRLRRGETDSQILAALNIDEFRFLFASAVLDYNLKQRIDHYPIDLFMIETNTPKIPISLYHYGIERRGGALTTIPPDRILRYLLPSAPGSIRGNGIYFRGELYDCDHSEIQAKMKVVAARRLKKTKKPKFMSVSLKFNPDGKADELYIPLSTGEYAPCKPKTPAFASLDRWELEEYQATDHADKTRHGVVERQVKAVANARRDEVVKKAQARTEQEITEHGLSLSARKRNKRETVAVERRLDESTDPVPVPFTLPDTLPSVQPSARKYIPPPSYLDLISEEYDDHE